MTEKLGYKDFATELLGIFIYAFLFEKVTSDSLLPDECENCRGVEIFESGSGKICGIWSVEISWKRTRCKNCRATRGEQILFKGRKISIGNIEEQNQEEDRK